MLLSPSPLPTSKFHQSENHYLRNSQRTTTPLVSYSPPLKGKIPVWEIVPQAITQIPFFYPPPGVQAFQVVATLTLPKMVLAIHVWYLHPSAMVPTPSLPPQIEGLPMQILVQDPTTPPPPPTSGNTTTTGGRRRKNKPISPLPPPRAQPPCALCKR
jgi:hypothetical protein